jgi:hypothetical protein
MTLSDQLAYDNGVVFNTEDFALSATYAAAGEFPIAITYLPAGGDGKEHQGADSFGTTKMIAVKAADLSAVSVRQGDAIKIPGDRFAENWEVDSAELAPGGLVWTMTISKVD